MKINIQTAFTFRLLVHWLHRRLKTDTHSNKPIHDCQASILFCAATFNDLGDEDAIVAWKVLITLSPCNAEPETCKNACNQTLVQYGETCKNASNQTLIQHGQTCKNACNRTLIQYGETCKNPCNQTLKQYDWLFEKSTVNNLKQNEALSASAESMKGVN